MLLVDFTCTAKAYQYAQKFNVACNIYHATERNPDIREGTCVLRFKNVDEVLIESLTPTELIGYLGIDPDYYISHEVIEL